MARDDLVLIVRGVRKGDVGYEVKERPDRVKIEYERRRDVTNNTKFAWVSPSQIRNLSCELRRDCARYALAKTALPLACKRMLAPRFIVKILAYLRTNEVYVHTRTRAMVREMEKDILTYPNDKTLSEANRLRDFARRRFRGTTNWKRFLVPEVTSYHVRYAECLFETLRETCRCVGDVKTERRVLAMWSLLRLGGDAFKYDTVTVRTGRRKGRTAVLTRKVRTQSELSQTQSKNGKAFGDVVRLKFSGAREGLTLCWRCNLSFHTKDSGRTINCEYPENKFVNNSQRDRLSHMFTTRDIVYSTKKCADLIRVRETPSVKRRSMRRGRMLERTFDYADKL